jgi:hypothetical protein
MISGTTNGTIHFASSEPRRHETYAFNLRLSGL